MRILVQLGMWFIGHQTKDDYYMWYDANYEGIYQHAIQNVIFGVSSTI